MTACPLPSGRAEEEESVAVLSGGLPGEDVQAGAAGSALPRGPTW